VRRQQSRDSCDSVAFARPRARRALTGLQDLDVRPCPTPPGWTKRRCGVPGSSAAWVAVCCGRKVAIFTWLHGKHVVGSSCDSSVLSVVLLYHVPKVCTRRIDGRTILGFVHSRIQRNPTPVISDSVSCFSLA